MERADLLSRVQDHIRRLELIPPGGEVTVLVSGGADSTCAWHVLCELGYRVSALHVNHGLRGEEADEDARFCRELLGAEILYRLVTSGRPTGIKPKREDGIVRPLLPIWRGETEAYCRAQGLDYRSDSTNKDTTRGLIRERILPLLREIHPAAEDNLLRALEQRPTLQPALAELIGSTAGSKRLDLGNGVQLVREYDRAWLERGPVAVEGAVRWGEWTIESELAGLKGRGWRPGDRLAGRQKKIQDVFVDAKIPRSEREAWPLVVRGDEVVAVPGVVEHPEVKAERVSD